MDRRIPGPGEMFMDQEGKPYQIVCVAEHIDTQEKMVVYQSLYGTFEFLIRPLGIFMRKMERKQKGMRDETDFKGRVIARQPGRIQDKTVPEERVRTEYHQNQKEEQADPALLEFLDADTLEEKYQVIKSIQHSVTDRLIDDFAVTLDLVIPDGRLEDRYQQLLSSVRTMQKFETTRFRR